MIKRELEDKIREKIGLGKAIIVYGARQVGKTTLLKQIFGDNPDVLWLNGDEKRTRDRFAELSAESGEALIGEHKVVIIDEAQRIEDIGIKLKILQDNFGDRVQLVATGSSSFDLANKINEPLTGRKWTFQLHPLTVTELISANGLVAEDNNFENRLIYGAYPAVATNQKLAQETVLGLSKESLFKDVLNLGDIIKTDKLEKILQALAFQIGSQVSMTEIGGLVGLDSKTVDKYITLLEQAFIIFRLPSFGRNLRNELKSSNKFYFYDTGIRNALIEDFRPLTVRQDLGALFENYVVAELKKQNPHRAYFWRTSQQQEVDYVTEFDAQICAAEIKWSEKKLARLPATFTEAYNPAEQYFIHRDNVLDLFATGQLKFLQK